MNQISQSAECGFLHQANSRKEMGKGLERTWKRDMLSRRLNPFPVDESELYASIWYRWLERIEKAHAEERVRLSECRDEDDAALESYISGTVSRSMYAALAVAVYSSAEHYLRLLISALGEEDVSAIGIQELIEKYKQVDIITQECHEFSTFNSVRIVANLFKHDGGLYPPKLHKNGKEVKKIDKVSVDIEKKWGLVDDNSNKRGRKRIPNRRHPIKYKNLPWPDIIIACGVFCNDLRQKSVNVFDKSEG
jgi:hypothetical protein